MSSSTGYIAKNGLDLSLVFQSGSGSQSGYKLSSGQDLGDVFATYTSYLAQPTGLFLSNGSDINTLYNGRSYIPLRITGCCLWLDAADITTISKDVSNKVGTWTDKSSSAYSFTQSTANNKPTYSTNTRNGNATIAFASGNFQYLSCTSPLAIGTSSLSLFVVGRYNDSSTTMTMFSKSRYNSQDGRFFVNRDSGKLFVTFYHPSSAHVTEENENYTTGEYRMFELFVNRTEGKDYFYQNGSVRQTITVSDATNYGDNGNVMLVGAYGNGSGTTPPQANYYLNGNISEIIIYKGSDMSILNRQTIEGYLAWKWGIQTMLPNDHPYKNLPPT